MHRLLASRVLKACDDSFDHDLRDSYCSRQRLPGCFGEARGGMNRFTDTFVPVSEGGSWVLSERKICTDAFGDSPASEQSFRFVDLTNA